VRPGWFRSEKVKREKGESEIPATISPGGGGWRLVIRECESERS